MRTADDLRVGAFLSSEEHGPLDLVCIGEAAASAGFLDQVVSDHYHPWVDAQGHSPFVWSVLGALATARGEGRLGTGVTCPTIRTHPAIIAQAAATSAVMAPGRFFLGVGTGEALNEHILGDRWPTAPERLDMLEEAVTIMRKLWSGAEVSMETPHYRVENARIYDLPDQPPPIMASAFGPVAAETVARFADGLVTTSPDADTVEIYRKHDGSGPAMALAKMCWAPDEKSARQTYARLWPSSGVPGELSQELRTPALFEQAVSVLTEEDAVGSTPVGPDPEVHAESLRTFAEAGFDEVYLQQVGPDQDQAYRFIRDEVLPRL